MKRLLIIPVVCVLLTLACSNVSYPDTIKTAIAQTQTAYPTATSTATPTNTPLPTETPAPTDTPEPTATPSDQEGGSSQAVEPSASMAELIQKLKNDNILDSDLEGETYKIKDVELESNQYGTVLSSTTNRSPKDFVLKADVSWTSDSGTNDWPVTGPIFLIGTGTYKLLRATDGILKRLTKGSITELPVPEGKAQMVVIVNRTLVKVYVDGKDGFTANYTGFLSPGWDSGQVSLGLVSGNTNGFGSRITMENIEIWETK
jgi:hypothetical protein